MHVDPSRHRAMAGGGGIRRDFRSQTLFIYSATSVDQVFIQPHYRLP